MDEYIEKRMSTKVKIKGMIMVHKAHFVHLFAFYKVFVCVKIEKQHVNDPIKPLQPT